MMIKEIEEIRDQLRDIAEKEAIKTWRMARRLQCHGGSIKLVEEIRNEAFEIERYPERLLDPFRTYKFSFK